MGKGKVGQGFSRAKFYKKASSQIVNLRKRKPELMDALNFCESLSNAQEEVNSFFSPDLSRCDTNSLKDRNSCGLSLLTSENVNIDWDLFNGLIEHIRKLIRHRKLDTTPQFEVEPPLPFSAIEEQNSNEWHRALVQSILKENSKLESLSAEADIDYNLFVFLIHQAFIPFMEKYAEVLDEYSNRNLWFKGYCPICGREPLMAKLEKVTGKRILQCCLCRTEWIFRRIECPFCGNRDQNSLRFFTVEDYKFHRVDVCDKCKKYIKTVDLRDRDEDITLFIEYVTTIYLDRLAQIEGFSDAEIGLLGV